MGSLARIVLGGVRFLVVVDKVGAALLLVILGGVRLLVVVDEVGTALLNVVLRGIGLFVIVDEISATLLLVVLRGIRLLVVVDEVSATSFEGVGDGLDGYWNVSDDAILPYRAAYDLRSGERWPMQRGMPGGLQASDS